MRINMAIKLLIYLSPSFVITAPGADAAVTTKTLSWQTESLQEGLMRLRQTFLDCSVVRDEEHVGGVLRFPDGSFAFTHGRGLPGQNQVSFRVRRPADAELVAFWHTHGGHGRDRSVFSPSDAKLVRETGKPFYLITPEGEIRVLKPQHLHTDRDSGRSSGSRSGLPRNSRRGIALADSVTEV